MLAGYETWAGGRSGGKILRYWKRIPVEIKIVGGLGWGHEVMYGLGRVFGDLVDLVCYRFVDFDMV